jgi:hypothetical protein
VAADEDAAPVATIGLDLIVNPPQGCNSVTQRPRELGILDQAVGHGDENRRKRRDGRRHEAAPFLVPVRPATPVQKQQHGQFVRHDPLGLKHINLLPVVVAIPNIHYGNRIRHSFLREPQTFFGIRIGNGEHKRLFRKIVEAHRICPMKLFWLQQQIIVPEPRKVS